VAIVGTLWKDPPLLAKVILIGFAIATSAASYYKLQEDEENKKFLQLALTATLIPSNSDYNKLYGDFDVQAEGRGYKVDEYPCHTRPTGLRAFSSPLMAQGMGL
jgi:hypothetical protein